MSNEARNQPAYKLTQSPLYRLPTIKALARALQWRGPPSALRALCRRRDNYDEYDQVAKSSGKVRRIEAPKPAIKLLQRRVDQLLKRIEAPDHLQSGIPGRSYLRNSARHMEKFGATVTVDITNFYPSVSHQRVYRLFRNVFQCEADVAWDLAGLLCCNGHLATGSPASAIASFHACRDMFEKIAARADRLGATFTLYIDDIAITGRAIGSGELAALESALARYGFQVKAAKSRIYRARQCKVITGRAIKRGVSRAPNAKHYKLRMAIAAARREPHNPGLLRTVAGLADHLALLDPSRVAVLKEKARHARRQLAETAGGGKTGG